LPGNQTGIEIPISKFQFPNNFQSPNDQIPKEIRLGHSKLEFGYCLGFGLPARSPFGEGRCLPVGREMGASEA
jgi:hypothetical protein